MIDRPLIFIVRFFGLLAAMLSLAGSVRAATFSEDFSSRTKMASSDLLWNQGTGYLTPTILVKDWSADNISFFSSSIDVGDGSNGAFNSTTWSQFATSVDNAGKIIYLDNTTYSTFKFTSFSLPTGWKIRPVGSSPLIIYVLGDMILEGQIQCQGVAGEDAVGATPGSGGAGRCGGASGGDGAGAFVGNPNTASSGLSPSGSLTGGGGGSVTTNVAGAGGGGGGSWSALDNFVTQLATVGAGGTGTLGAKGTSHSDAAWSTVLGSAGGGGGSGANGVAGAGGGGGGGVVILHVGGDLTLKTGSAILVSGGNGGATTTAAGAGGGGGGGSVRVWVGGALALQDVFPNNQIDASGGVAGASSGGGGDGGTGFAGRTWTASGSYSSAGASIDPTSELQVEGDARYKTGTTQTAISTVFDTVSSLADFSNATFSPASNDVSLDFSGSNDAFVNDDSGWVSWENVANISNKRYVRFRVRINNTNQTTPARVDSLSVVYTPKAQTQFEMKSTGCGVIKTPPPGSGGPLAWSAILWLLPLYAVWLLRRRFKRPLS